MNANETFTLPKLTDTQQRCLMAAKSCTASTEKLRRTRKLPVGPTSAALAKMGLAVKWTAYGEKRHSGYTLTDEGMLVFETYIANEIVKRKALAGYLRTLSERLENAETPWGMREDDAFGIVRHLGAIEDASDALSEIVNSFESRAYGVCTQYAPTVQPPKVETVS